MDTSGQTQSWKRDFMTEIPKHPTAGARRAMASFAIASFWIVQLSFRPSIACQVVFSRRYVNVKCRQSPRVRYRYHNIFRLRLHTYELTAHTLRHTMRVSRRDNNHSYQASYHALQNTSQRAIIPCWKAEDFDATGSPYSPISGVCLVWCGGNFIGLAYLIHWRCVHC